MAYTLKQLVTAYTAAHDGIAPDAETTSQLQIMTNASFTDQQRLGFILDSAQNSTALAVLSYQFFTGKSPTQAGLAYLVNSSTNPNDLNDAYYSKFSLENRYINFASGLGVQGEGAAAFSAKYGALSFADYVASIYETIVGASYAKAAGIDPAKAIADITGRYGAILATAQSAGMITAGMTQAQIDIAVKAATAGYLLGEAIKADVGLYAAAADNFVLALTTGTAVYNTDITVTYAPTASSGASGVGQPVTNAPAPDTVVGYDPPPPPPPPEPDPVVAHVFTLTTGADTFTGEGADDTFNGVANYNMGAETGNRTTTFNVATDTLDGAGGYDTLALTMAGTNNPNLTIDPTRVRNIERLSVTASVSTTTVNLATTSSFTDLAVIANASSTTITGYGNNVTNLAVSNQRTGTVRFAVNNTTLGGANDVVTLTLTNEGTSTTSAQINLTSVGANATDYYETLNIVSSGTANYVQVATGVSYTSLSKINISGAAPLTLVFSTIGNLDKAYYATTIDASTDTGGVTIGSGSNNTSLAAVDHTVILGTGANVVFFGSTTGVSNLNANDTVDGSRGTNDTIAITAGVTSAAFAHVTGVENIRLWSNGASITQDITQLPTGVGLQVGGSGTATLQNLASNATVDVVQNSFNLNLAMALANNGPGGSDALTLRFNILNGTSGALNTLNDISGLETLNIVSNTGTQNIISDDRVTARHVVTGSVDVSLSFGAPTGPVVVDGSTFTGKLAASVPNGQNFTVYGGTGADVFTGTGVDKFVLGVQGRNFQSGYDLISANGSSSTVAFVGNTAAGTGAATDYLGSGVSIRAGSSSVHDVVLTFSADNHDFSLKNAAGTAFTGLAKGSVAQGLGAGDTMIVQNVAQNDSPAVATANVSMISLTTATPFPTDIKTLFQTAIGSASITGLAADANYLVSVYDSTNHWTVIGVVNTGASGAGDTTLSAADFTNSGVALVGEALSPSLMAGMSLGAAF